MSMGSIYSSLSGLLAFSKALENSSNNVSNLNTPGYKGKDVRFSELANFSEGNTSRGDGAKIEGSQIRFQNGDLSDTGNDTDLAIDGQGFFILRTNEGEYYTRAGRFEFDSDGIFVDPVTGFRVAGTNDGDKLIDISLNDYLFSDPEITTSVSIAGNLNSGTLVGEIVNAGADSPLEIDVVDSLGVARKLEVNFEKQLGNQWTAQLVDQLGNPVGKKEDIYFGADGNIRSEYKEFSTTYRPYSLQSAEQTKEVFSAPGGYSFSEGDPVSGGGMEFALDADVQFIVRDVDGGHTQFISTGEFGFDGDGYLIDSSTSERVAGIGTEGTLIDFSLQGLTTNPAQPTNKVVISGNLDSDLVNGSVVPASGEPEITFEIIQTDGSHLTVVSEFTKQSDQVWEVVLRDDLGSLIAGPLTLNYQDDDTLAAESRAITVSFPDSNDSTLSVELSFYESDSESLTQISGNESEVSLTANGVDSGTIESLVFDEEGFAQIEYSNGNLVEGPRIAIADRGSEAIAEFHVSLDGLTSLSGINSVEVGEVNGRPAGRLSAYNFDESGKIVFSYSNGESADGPSVALANFININGLSSLGETLFTADKTAGKYVGIAGEQGLGSIQGGSIELSNVELSREFAEIIIIQRGYQASSQIMNVTSELIETLYNNVRGQ